MYTLNKKKYSRTDTEAVVTFSSENTEGSVFRNINIPRNEDGSINKKKLDEECEKLDILFQERFEKNPEYGIRKPNDVIDPDKLVYSKYL